MCRAEEVWIKTLENCFLKSWKTLPCGHSRNGKTTDCVRIYSHGAIPSFNPAIGHRSQGIFDMIIFETVLTETGGITPPGRNNQEGANSACALAIAIAAAFCDRNEEDISAASRSSAPICEARHIAIYLAHVVFQQPLREVAKAFARDRTSIGHALRRVEDRRDEPTFDAFLCKMERVAARCHKLISANGRGVAQ